MVTNELTQRRTELDDYSGRIERVLVDPKLQPEVQNAKSYDMRGTIGSLARCLVIIGEEDRALNLADGLLRDTSSDEYIAKGVYGELAKEGSKKSVDIYRSLIEVNRNKIGENDSNDRDYSNYWYCDDLIDLYKIGDEVAGATARTLIEAAGADELEGFGVRAVKLFQAGDESAFPLLLDTIDKAIAHHYSKEDEVSEVDRLLAATSRSAVIERETVPGSNVIRHLTIYTKLLAIDLIKKGDLARAEELQSRLPKEIDRVHLDAIKVTEGLDETGKYKDSVNNAVESDLKTDPIFDVQASLDVMEASVLAGNTKAITHFEAIVQQELEEQDVTDIGINAAHALWKAGRMSEEDFDTALNAIQSPSLKYEVLENLGRTEEALQLVRGEFAKNPRNVTNAYNLLRLEYNEEAMDIVQNDIGEYDTSVMPILRRRAVWLEVLARHIQKSQMA